MDRQVFKRVQPLLPNTLPKERIPLSYYCQHLTKLNRALANQQPIIIKIMRIWIPIGWDYTYFFWNPSDCYKLEHCIYLKAVRSYFLSSDYHFGQDNHSDFWDLGAWQHGKKWVKGARNTRTTLCTQGYGNYRTKLNQEVGLLTVMNVFNWLWINDLIIFFSVLFQKRQTSFFGFFCLFVCFIFNA